MNTVERAHCKNQITTGIRYGEPVFIRHYVGLRRRRQIRRQDADMGRQLLPNAGGPIANDECRLNLYRHIGEAICKILFHPINQPPRIKRRSERAPSVQLSAFSAKNFFGHSGLVTPSGIADKGLWSEYAPC